MENWRWTRSGGEGRMGEPFSGETKIMLANRENIFNSFSPQGAKDGSPALTGLVLGKEKIKSLV